MRLLPQVGHPPRWASSLTVDTEAHAAKVGNNQLRTSHVVTLLCYAIIWMTPPPHLGLQGGRPPLAEGTPVRTA